MIVIHLEAADLGEGEGAEARFLGEVEELEPRLEAQAIFDVVMAQ